MTRALWDGAGQDPDVEGGVNTGSGCIAAAGVVATVIPGGQPALFWFALGK